MADLYVKASGSNTAPYDTWAKAATSFLTAVNAAGAGDRIFVDSAHNEDFASTAMTFTFASGVRVYSTSDTTNQPPTSASAGARVYSSIATAVSVSISGDVYIFGMTLETSQGGTAVVALCGQDDNVQVFEECTFNQAAAGTTNGIFRIGESANGSGSVLVTKRCTWKSRANTSNRLWNEGCRWESYDDSFWATDAVPTGPVFNMSADQGCDTYIEGGDLSGVTSTLFNGQAESNSRARLVNCKLGSGVTVLGTTTSWTGPDISLFNCSAGDEHYHIAHFNALGSTTVDTGIYANDGAQYDGTNRCSWKIVTTSLAAHWKPYVSPRFDRYNDTLSAMTPSIEILRDGSTTAYQDDEVWGEWSYQGTSGSTRSSFADDRMALLGSPSNQAAGVGTSGWTGEGGSAWSGKLQPASTITPAEIGHIRGRVLVGEPSITVYVDPQTRLA